MKWISSIFLKIGKFQKNQKFHFFKSHKAKELKSENGNNKIQFPRFNCPDETFSSYFPSQEEREKEHKLKEN